MNTADRAEAIHRAVSRCSSAIALLERESKGLGFDEGSYGFLVAQAIGELEAALDGLSPDLESLEEIIEQLGDGAP